MRIVSASVLALMLVHLSARADGTALVFDPPSNVRTQANSSSQILCSITERNKSIKTQRQQGVWFLTDACGTPGWIHSSQIKQYTTMRVRIASTPVRSAKSETASILCKSAGGVRTFKKDGVWYETDYCGGPGWIAASALESSASPVPVTANVGSRWLAAAPACASSFQCQEASVLPVCADAATAECIDGKCHFQRKPQSTCPCYASELRECPSAANQFNYCVSTDVNSAIWQVQGSTAVCGPSEATCDPRRAECPAGTQTTLFNASTQSWVPSGECVPARTCPRDGETRVCDPSPSCKGSQTYSASGWSGCVATPGCIESPIYLVDPQTGPQVDVASVTCFGSPTTGPPRPMPTPRLVNIANGAVLTLEHAGGMSMNLNSSRFKDARVQILFDGAGKMTHVVFRSMKVRNGTAKVDRDAAMGDLREVNGGFQLVRDLEAPLILRVTTDKMKQRFHNEVNLHCGRTVVYGHYVGTELEVESYEGYAGMAYFY